MTPKELKGNKMKSWLKSKTIWFNIAIAFFGVLEAKLSLFQGQLGGYYPIVLLVISFIGIALRTVTTQPLNTK